MGIAYRSVLKDVGTGGVHIDSVTITSYPDTTTYFAGDKLDLSGLVVYAEVGSLSGDVTNDCTFIPADGDILTASTNKITVKYGNEKLDIPLTVVMPTAITITSQPTKTNYKTDAPLDFTGLVVTASNSEAGLSADVTSACTFNPAEGTVLDEEKTYTISVSYCSLSASFDIVCQNLPAWDERGLNYNSWETIQTYIKEGLFSTVASVGQTKSFIAGGKTYNAEVVAINDGTGSAGSWYPNKTVDFITKELYPTKYKFYNSGVTNVCFADSDVKSVLNDTIYPLLPSDLKDVIMAKNHKYNAYSNATKESTDNLWLPTGYEIYAGEGQASYRKQEINTAINKQYTLSNKSKADYNTIRYWWLGTVVDNNDRSQAFAVDNMNGEIVFISCTNTSGVPICFRVG